MKNTSQKSPTKPGRNKTVHLEFEHPSAHSVCVAGSFNDWHPVVTEMIRLDDQHWGKDLVLPPGIYEYRFVVDGEWVTDPKAAEAVPNPFGSSNSILRA